MLIAWVRFAAFLSFPSLQRRPGFACGSAIGSCAHRSVRALSLPRVTRSQTALSSVRFSLCASHCFLVCLFFCPFCTSHPHAYTYSCTSPCLLAGFNVTLHLKRQGVSTTTGDEAVERAREARRREKEKRITSKQRRRTGSERQSTDKEQLRAEKQAAKLERKQWKQQAKARKREEKQRQKQEKQAMRAARRSQSSVTSDEGGEGTGASHTPTNQGQDAAGDKRCGDSNGDDDDDDDYVTGDELEAPVSPVEKQSHHQQPRQKGEEGQQQQQQQQQPQQRQQQQQQEQQQQQQQQQQEPLPPPPYSPVAPSPPTAPPPYSNTAPMKMAANQSSSPMQQQQPSSYSFVYSTGSTHVSITLEPDTRGEYTGVCVCVFVCSMQHLHSWLTCATLASCPNHCLLLTLIPNFLVLVPFRGCRRPSGRGAPRVQSVERVPSAVCVCRRGSVALVAAGQRCGGRCAVSAPARDRRCANHICQRDAEPICLVNPL